MIIIKAGGLRSNAKSGARIQLISNFYKLYIYVCCEPFILTCIIWRNIPVAVLIVNKHFICAHFFAVQKFRYMIWEAMKIRFYALIGRTQRLWFQEVLTTLCGFSNQRIIRPPNLQPNKLVPLTHRFYFGHLT